MGIDCVYVASRRGYNRFQADPAKTGEKRPRISPTDRSEHTPNTPSSHPPPATAAPITAHLPTATPSAFMSSPSQTPTLSPNQLSGLFRGPDELGISGFELDFPEPEVSRRATPLRDECIRAFYRYFHAAHPFVLPEDFLLRFDSQGSSIRVLLPIMRWIGSSYLYTDRPSARANLLDDAYRLIYNPTTPRDAFLVQAMMLLVIGLDGAGQYNKGKGLLMDAKELALEIGLNTRAFALLYSQGLPALEESWRRTWWELYILDGMFAGVHRVTEFTLFDQPADVALPCEESQYETGVGPPSKIHHPRPHPESNERTPRSSRHPSI